jgi:hypothetical protein
MDETGGAPCFLFNVAKSSLSLLSSSCLDKMIEEPGRKYEKVKEMSGQDMASKAEEVLIKRNITRLRNFTYILTEVLTCIQLHVINKAFDHKPFMDCLGIGICDNEEEIIIMIVTPKMDSNLKRF